MYTYIHRDVYYIHRDLYCVLIYIEREGEIL